MNSVISLFFLLILTIVQSNKLPEGLPKCSKSDPNLNDCLKKAIEVFFQKFSDGGIPELGIKTMDPTYLPALDVAQGSGPVSVDLKFRDLYIHGLKNIVVTNLKADAENYKFTIDNKITTPVTIEADYEINGKILVLPVVGKGKAHVTLEQPKGYLNMTGKLEKRGDDTYMNLENFDFRYETSRIILNFEGLLSKDHNLSDNINAFLNEHWEELHKEVEPVFTKVFTGAAKKTALNVFSKVPYNEIFLP